MKASAILFALCAETAFSASLPGHELSKRQSDFGAFLQGLTSRGYGKVPAPPGSAPTKVVTESPLKVPGVANMKRVKIRAGPYKVPDMGVKSVMGHAGMLENYFDNTIQKPCTGDCTIFRQQGGLEYTNGTNANIDTGMWLHHMVQFNTGADTWDPVGYNARICMPHMGFGSSAKKSERFFVTGNERGSFNFYNEASGVKSAYHVKAADKFTYLVELMNMNMSPQVVWLTMTYDIADGALPEGFSAVKTVYLDVASCGTSEVMPPKQEGQFTISSKPWKPTVEGKIVYALGHLHDGGVAIDITADKSQPMCKSETIYSGTTEYVYRGTAMNGDKVAKDHISGMKDCQPKDFQVKEMKRTQNWVTNGYYDYAQRAGNLEGGKQSEIMTIFILLIAVPPGVKPVLTAPAAAPPAAKPVKGV